MPRQKTIRAPTTASLPNNLRIPSTTPSLVKALGKLSRQSLLDLVFQWLDDRNVKFFPPFLESDETKTDSPDDEGLRPYPAERTLNDVRNAYQELQFRKGGKREVIDRILDGDWRHGITLRQLAMVDIRYLDDHPSSSRWTALELARIGVSLPNADTDISACMPRVHASTFLTTLQHQISPLVKAHFYLSRSSTLPLTFLRIFVTHSPYQNPRQAPETLTDSTRVMYVAFPDSCPYIYTSLAPTTATGAKPSAASAVATDARSLQRIVRDAVPKALSLPHQRYTLKTTSLTAKSLQALLTLRGSGRSNKAAGAFSIFADAVIEGSPLDPRPSNTVTPEEHYKQSKPHNDVDPEKENNSLNTEKEADPSSTTQNSKLLRRKDTSDLDPRAAKKRKMAVNTRFGTSGTPLSSAPLDRLDARLLDSPNPSPSSDAADDASATDESRPSLSLTFSGTDVIAGIRKLAELGIVNAERMPAWMTGEDAISVAVVKRGKVVRDSG
ncbi:centromere protein Chl4/mis15/CENP-N [Aspergillus pseudodeflectus]|uniref:Centromere protein Chl4/mis15/CENP-N n=1 Tax=Aspergillus pseudodeflectus TaxID=176178 RepID=A0ABR4JCA3_9EURO